MRRRGWLVWMTVAAAAAAADEVPRQAVGRDAAGRLITPVNQVVTPAGRTVELPGLRPQAVAISPDGTLLAAAGKTNEVLLVDPASGAVRQRVKPPAEDAAPHAEGQTDRNLSPDTQAIESFTGLAFSPDGTRLVMSNVHGSVKVFTVAGGTVAAAHTIQLPPARAPQRAREIPAGLAFSADGGRLYVCGNLSNRLLELDAATGRLLRTFDAGVAPYDVVLAGGRAFVSNWGGRRPGRGDVTGPAGKGTRVRVDPRTHVASEGSVSVVDLATGEDVCEIPAGRHASGLAVSPDGRHVVCANAADDTLTIIDAATAAVVDTAWTKRTPAELFGAAPNAVAFAADGRRLYVCNGSQNAVAVMEWNPDMRGGTRLVGLVPVGWYPGAIAVDAARGQLVVANLKGLPAKGRMLRETATFNSHQHHGSLSLVPLPGDAELASLSETVARNLRAPAIEQALLPPRDGVPPRAIPERIGEPSLIEHVVYVIKENRTYDQVLGDMPQGNGFPALCIFGAAITPNHHALAEQFVLLDNTSCCGILSADGHNWSTSAVATDYVEKSFAGFPRSYPDGMGDGETDALAWSPAGFIWDSVLRRGKTVRNFGEFMMPRVRWADPARKGRPGFAACHAAWKQGREGGDVRFACEPAIESIRGFSPRHTVGWDMAVPDQLRADVVIEELAECEKRGAYPHLTIICLPNDHTNGTAAGSATPAACMADNDLALGRIVEALSRSRFWPRMAVFAIEDDPQAGWDHVSGYRTVCLVASPFAKRGVTVSTPYNTTSILRTIGQILGLPPMNQFDASATPLADCFTDTADLRPFAALPATVPLDQMNPDPKAILDPLLKAGAIISASMNFAEIDRAPEAALNRVLWHAMKGSAAEYPEWAAGAEDEADDDARAGDDRGDRPLDDEPLDDERSRLTPEAGTSPRAP
ncbi:MAG: alkaline phosphatase family protein [Planctomycetaceae bacterium]